MNFSQMSLDNGILHLANWVGNVIMPTIAAVFVIMAILQFSKGQEFSHSMYGALVCLMVSGLTRALETLPPRYREVLVLRELEGCSYKEIAAITSIPIGTVMSSLSRARRQLFVVLDGSPGSEEANREM